MPTFSFCIITNGKRPEMLRTVVASIRRQQIPDCEIIVSGDCSPEEGVIFVPCQEAAARGYLGRMRNLAVAKARYDNIVLLDDDIFLAPSWYKAFCERAESFDILTSQVRLPDGGRYWDHATIGGPRGHVLLNADEYDDFVYMTGGGGWVMRREVAQKVQWDDERAFYEGEDVDFSRRCQSAGFNISHCHEMIVFHADPSYTCVGRRVFRRFDGWRTLEAKNFIESFSRNHLFKEVVRLSKNGKIAESADILRLFLMNHPFSFKFRLFWCFVVKKCGGNLKNSSWFFDGDPLYKEIMENYVHR